MKYRAIGGTTPLHNRTARQPGNTAADQRQPAPEFQWLTDLHPRAGRADVDKLSETAFPLRCPHRLKHFRDPRRLSQSVSQDLMPPRVLSAETAGSGVPVLRTAAHRCIATGDTSVSAARLTCSGK